MTSSWFDGDEQLLGELGLARSEQLPGPAQGEMIMVGYDVVMVETIEAVLIHDSDVDLTTAVRSVTAGARMLSFEADGLEIDFELVGGRIVGHIDPPQGGMIRLEQPIVDGSEPVTVTPGDLGAFEFPLRHPGTFRLRFVDVSGRSVATGWLNGPHQTLT